MGASAPLPEGDPRLISWKAYQETEEFANTKEWLSKPQHVIGSLWAVYLQGYTDAQKGKGTHDSTDNIKRVKCD